MLRWVATAGVGGVLTLFALLLVKGRRVVKGRRGWSGPVVLPLVQGHGLHLADVAVLGLWALALAALVVLVVAPPAASGAGRAPVGRRSL